MELKGKKINFLGDSITEGVGASASDRVYWRLIAERTGAICRGYGISGTRIARQFTPTVDQPSFDLDFCRRALEMDDDADIVVVFGGTNDFGHGDAPIGTMADRTPDTFCGGLHTLYRELVEKYPSSAIVILTPLHRCNEDNPRGDGNKPQDVGVLKTYVELIREAAEYYSLPVLDLYACSGIQPKIPIMQEKYMPDGLHPNDAGYSILADKLIAFLRAL